MAIFRKLLPAELGEYINHLLRLDREDRFSRFAGTVSDEVIRQHCLRIDWSQTIIVGCFDGGMLRGVTELRMPARLWPDTGEIAFSVERGYQNQGIGTALMRRILTVARNRGVRTVELVCLMDNRRMMALSRKFKGKLIVDRGEVGVDFRLGRPNQITLMLELIEDGTGAVTAVFDHLQAGVAEVMAPMPVLQRV